MIEHNTSNSSVVKGELQLFRTIWNNSSDNMFIVKQDKNGEFINESCNRAQEKTFHLTPHQVDGVKLKDILDEENYKQIAERYKLCISLNKPVTYEESIIIDDTGTRYFNTTILPIKDDENTRIFGISREITEQKNIQKERLDKEQEKLIIEQSKNTQMRELMSNISHQWFQPLSVISTAASSMKLANEMGSSNKTDELNLIDAIIENTEYLSKITGKFQKFIEDEKIYKEVILQDTLNNAINFIHASLKNNNVNLIHNINSIKMLKVKVDNHEFTEVILNIIENSKDAIHKNKIENSFVKVTLEQKDNTAIIIIEDNGGGISEENLPKIFDPYFTTKHKSIGTGLGLCMSKKIIEQNLHGKLSVKNTNIGAAFFIELPLSDF